MTSFIRPLIAICALSALGACSSTPDPAKVCTADWISARSDKAIDSIQDRASSSLKALRKVSDKAIEGKSPNLLDKLALLNAVNGMKKELTRGQGIKDLKTVAEVCNDPNIIKNAMSGLMKQNGMSDSFIQNVQNNPIYQSLISTISAPDPITKSNG